MPDLSFVTVDFYKSYQYTRLREEYRGLIAVGMDSPRQLEMARDRLNLDEDTATAAYIEAKES